MRPLIVLLLLATALAAQGTRPSSSPAPKWESLFNGKDLTGWTPRDGPGRYVIEDGCIVGVKKPGQATGYLCHRRRFGDFELEVEFKIDAGFNSGIQIRSNLRKKDSGVFGYQVEIDPSKRAWTAGIYDQSRRGWIHDLKKNDAARAAFRHDEWNEVRILAVGPRIRTWLNEVPASDLTDPLTMSGFIALQLHGTSGKERKIRWRGIRIRELGAHAWRPYSEKGVPLALKRTRSSDPTTVRTPFEQGLLRVRFQGDGEGAIILHRNTGRLGSVSFGALSNAAFFMSLGGCTVRSEEQAPWQPDKGPPRYRNGGSNTVYVRVFGDSVSTWMNGERNAHVTFTDLQGTRPRHSEITLSSGDLEVTEISHLVRIR